MNFLAHLVLSPGGEKIMAGNFFADRVRGSSWKSLEADYAQGVLLHRRIDHFTDQHPIVREAKQFIHPRFGLFRGVLLDVFWDHFLACDFDRHTGGLDLAEFAEYAHQTLAAHAPVFHPEAPRMIDAMVRGQWLVGYAEMDGVDRVLRQMSQRFPLQNPMGEGADALREAHGDLEPLFNTFWLDLVAEFGLYSKG